MLHRFFKWRYERQARSGAFKLPKSGRSDKPERANLGSYLSHTSGHSRGFRPFDQPRKRRKFMQYLATLLIIALVAWVTYESLIALALIGK
ncbi:hypothetical protein [Coraliomargarita sinensis]|nr:hypothetical protein [Coraliomargarita sinensis]